MTRVGVTRVGLFGLLLLLGPDPITARATAPAPAPLTELESLKVQNLRLEGQLVQRALTDWQQHVAAVKADLERVRPGWDWDPETGQWKARSNAPK